MTSWPAQPPERKHSLLINNSHKILLSVEKDKKKSNIISAHLLKNKQINGERHYIKTEKICLRENIGVVNKDLTILPAYIYESENLFRLFDPITGNIIDISVNSENTIGINYIYTHTEFPYSVYSHLHFYHIPYRKQFNIISFGGSQIEQFALNITNEGDHYFKEYPPIYLSAEEQSLCLNCVNKIRFRHVEYNTCEFFLILKTDAVVIVEGKIALGKSCNTSIYPTDIFDANDYLIPITLNYFIIPNSSLQQQVTTTNRKYFFSTTFNIEHSTIATSTTGKYFYMLEKIPFTKVLTLSSVSNSYFNEMQFEIYRRPIIDRTNRDTKISLYGKLLKTYGGVDALNRSVLYEGKVTQKGSFIAEKYLGIKLHPLKTKINLSYEGNNIKIELLTEKEEVVFSYKVRESLWYSIFFNKKQEDAFAPIDLLLKNINVRKTPT